MIQNQTKTSPRHPGPVIPAPGTEPDLEPTTERTDPTPTAASRPPATTGSGHFRPDLPRSPLALWCARHRWVVLGTSLLLVLGSIGLLGAVGITTTDANDQLVGDSAEAYDIVDGADFGDVPTEFIIVTDPVGPLAPDRAAELGAELVATYETVPGVVDVGDVFPGQDGSIVLPLELDTDEEGVALEIDGSLRATDELAAAHGDLTISQFGQTSLDQEMNDTVGEDFRRAELFAIPVTLIILLLAFGTVLAAAVPLVIGLGSVAAALGLTAIVSTWMPVDQNSQAIVLLIGLAVGVDYALLILRRAREERRAGASVPDSIGIAGATAGRAVLISGLTVVIAMSGMLVAGGMFTSLGLGAMLVVSVAVVAAVTVLPALMGLLGDKIDALRLPFIRRREARRGSEETFWGHLAGVVTRHPLAAVVVVGGLLVTLAAPALGMKTAIGNVEALPQDLKSVQAYHQFNAAVPAQSDSLQVVVRAPAEAADEVEAALLGTTAHAEGIEHIAGVASEVMRSTDSTVTTWDLGLDVTPSDDEIAPTVDQVRAELLPQVRAELADVPGTDVHLGGQAAVVDLTTWMEDSLPWVVGFVLVLSLLVMLVSFGSPALAVATVGLNLLSVGAAYGALVVVFGGTWAEGLLDFTSTGVIASWLPMMLFVLLFGLSMDYHIFVTSRVREAFDAGASPRRAVRQGVARSAGVVTGAAAVMVGVFSIFGTLSLLEMKQLGVGLAVAVLIDATVVRGVLLPAVLTLLGERAHTGPTWLPRLHH